MCYSEKRAAQSERGVVTGPGCIRKGAGQMTRDEDMEVGGSIQHSSLNYMLRRFPSFVLCRRIFLVRMVSSG